LLSIWRTHFVAEVPHPTLSRETSAWAEAEVSDPQALGQELLGTPTPLTVMTGLVPVIHAVQLH